MKDVRNHTHTRREVCFVQFLGVDDEDADHITSTITLINRTGGAGYHRARLDNHLSPRLHIPAPGLAGSATLGGPGPGDSSLAHSQQQAGPPIQNITIPSVAKASGSSSLPPPAVPIQHQIIPIDPPEMHSPPPIPKSVSPTPMPNVSAIDVQPEIELLLPGEPRPTL